MHCSGLRTHAAFLDGVPDEYLQPSVGMTLTFGA
jgi:hypothetical protein